MTGLLDIMTGLLEIMTGLLEIMTGLLEIMTGLLEIMTGLLEIMTGLLEIMTGLVVGLQDKQKYYSTQCQSKQLTKLFAIEIIQINSEVVHTEQKI